MDITVCRLCLSDGSTNNMVPLIKKSENKLTCYGLSVVRMTQIEISITDDLPQFMCKKCLLQLRQSIEFKLRCESSNNSLSQLVKVLQNEYTDKKRLHTEIVQHAMFIHSNIISSDESLSSICYVPAQRAITDHKNSLSTVSLLEKSSEMPSSKEDELLRKMELLYSSDYEVCGPIDDLSNENTENQNFQDNIQLLPSLEAMVNEQLSRNKNTTNPPEEEIKKSQSLTDQETLVLVDKMFGKYPQYFSSRKPLTSKEYICKICNKVLASLRSYKYHSRRHKNLYNLICEHCGKGFDFQTHLNLHTVAVHKTGEYLECKKCPFRAARPSLLVEHERLHTGERPFACDKCGLTFRRQAILKNHIKYHKEKTVQCPHCPKKFCSKWHMMSHINSAHERSYLYLCPVCGVKYAKNTTVRRHLFEKHGIAKHMQGKITRIKL